MFKSLALLALVLLAGAAAGEQTTKDTKVEKYYEISTWTTNYPPDYVGWINVSVHVKCVNMSLEDYDPVMGFPYEEVTYILAVRSLGDVLERVAEKNFILTEECDFTADGKYYVTPSDTNITFVNLFKPAHSRIPARQYFSVGPTRGAEMIFGGTDVLASISQFFANPLRLLLLGAGALACLLSLILLPRNIMLAIFVFLIACSLLIAGFIFGGAPLPSLPTQNQNLPLETTSTTTTTLANLVLASESTSTTLLLPQTTSSLIPPPIIQEPISPSPASSTIAL